MQLKKKMTKEEAQSVHSLPRNLDYYQNKGSYKSLVPPKYVNSTGPGDYNHSTGISSAKVDSTQPTQPTYSMGSKTKMPYFPSLDLVRQFIR